MCAVERSLETWPVVTDYLAVRNGCEKYVNIEIIVGIPFLFKAVIFSVQGIPEVLLSIIGISKSRADNYTHAYSCFLFPFYIFSSTIPAFQLPVT